MRTLILFLALFFCQNIFSQEGFIIDHRHTDLSQIPDEYIMAAKNDLKIRYFRRSHGSQLDLGGMTSLERYSSEYETKYAFSKTGTGGSLFLSTQNAAEPWNSLDFENDIWVAVTRAYLDDPANAQINVVMWAWSSYLYLCSVQQYINDMEMLISEYGPGGSKNRAVPVTFVFQTACGQRSNSRNEILYYKNDSIRKHCNNNNRILFDFNDIECYDPDGNYFGDGNPDGSYTNIRRLGDDCAYTSSNPGGSVNSDCRNWGIDWINSNAGSELAKLAGNSYCESCAHSEGEEAGDDDSRLHCVLKGRAAWWMWAVLAGWEAGMTTNIEQTQNNENASDLKNYPNPFESRTTIVYNLKENADVQLELFNSRGQRIKTLVMQKQLKGNYSVPVDIDNKNGVYFYTLKVDGKQISNKMLKLK